MQLNHNQNKIRKSSKWRRQSLQVLAGRESERDRPALLYSFGSYSLRCSRFAGSASQVSGSAGQRETHTVTDRQATQGPQGSHTIVLYVKLHSAAINAL